MPNDRNNQGMLPEGVLPSAAIAGAGMASPFAGMLGESKITKDPYYNQKIKRMSADALSDVARPGDVMVMSKRRDGSTYYKVPQHFTTGAEYYHAEPILSGASNVRKVLDPEVMNMIGEWDDFPKYTSGPNAGKPYTKQDLLKKVKGMVDPEDFDDMLDLSDEFWTPEKAVGARSAEAGTFSKTRGPKQFGMSTKRLIEESGDNISDRMSGIGGNYDDVVLMRPKKGVTPEQAKKFQEAIASGAKKEYSGPQGAKALLHDLFVPKIPGVHTKANTKRVCNSHMCASLPADATEKILGQKVVPGKSSRMTLPADFLRESSPFEAVGASLEHSKQMLNPKQVLKRRLLTRAGIGGTLAGTGLLAYHEPEALGGIAAGVGVPMLLDKGYRSLKGADPANVKNKTLSKLVSRTQGMLPAAKSMLPSAAEVAGTALDPLNSGAKLKYTPEHMKVLKRFAKRSLPLGLAAGAGTYGLLKHLRSDKDK